jgi:HK97 family phage major capsid protein
MTTPYSLSRLILALGGNSGEQAKCEELQLSRNILEPQARCPTRMGGALLPIVASGLATKTDTSGGFLVGTTVGGEILEAVRVQARVTRLGAQIITADRGGMLSLPCAESGTAVSWQNEDGGTDVVETDPVLSVRNATPHTLVATVSYSRQLIAQATPAVESFLRRDMARAIAVETDRVAIQGIGHSGEPLGLTGHSLIPIIAVGTNGGLATADVVYELEESVGKANLETTGFLTTPQQRRLLRKVPKIATGTSEPLWDTDGLLGYPSYTSTNVPSTLSKGTTNSSCHAIIGGDWSQLAIAVWDLSIVPDQYSRKKQGLIELNIYTTTDVIVLRDSGFAMCLDATTS